MAAASTRLRRVRMTDRLDSSSSESVLKASSRPNGIRPCSPRTSSAATNTTMARTVSTSLRRAGLSGWRGSTASSSGVDGWGTTAWVTGMSSGWSRGHRACAAGLEPPANEASSDRRLLRRARSDLPPHVTHIRATLIAPERCNPAMRSRSSASGGFAAPPCRRLLGCRLLGCRFRCSRLLGGCLLGGRLLGCRFRCRRLLGGRLFGAGSSSWWPSSWRSTSWLPASDFFVAVFSVCSRRACMRFFGHQALDRTLHPLAPERLQLALHRPEVSARVGPFGLLVPVRARRGCRGRRPRR